MKEQIISKAYAKSILDLGGEMNIDIASEITNFSEVINTCNDLENVLFLDIFTDDEKKSVLDGVFGKVSFSPLLKNFVFFLLEEKRIHLFPLIFKEVVVLDDEKKGFIRGTIEGSEATLSSDVQEKIKAYIKSQLGRSPELQYKQSDSVTAGYRVTVEDLQLDASIDNQLESFKQSIIGE